MTELDAGTLRELKRVSRAWQWRARTVLGEESSAWRQSPVWTTRAETLALVGTLQLAGSAQARQAALTALVTAADATIELPAYVEALLQQVSK